MKKQTLNINDLLIKTLGNPERNPRQIELLKATQKYIAFGGSRGGGKSAGIRIKAVLLSLQYAGIRILLLRRTLQELRENHTIPLRTAFEKFPKAIRPKYNDDEKAFTFFNGSRLKLGYCDNEGDVLQYQGQEYDIIMIDEATQFSEFMYSALTAVIRGVNNFPKRMYLSCNPGGVGHANIRRLFIDREYRAEENPDDYLFIQAKVWDNQPLFDADIGYQNALKQYCEKHNLEEPDEDAIWYAKDRADYVIALKNLPYHLREAWLNGRWDIFAGQYFGEFDRDIHTCEPFEIKKHWRKSIAIDYGLDMLAVLWVAVDEKGNAWVYRELMRENYPISMAAHEILKETPKDEYIEANIAPPDLWNRQKDTGVPMAETFAKSGVPLIKAGNDRIHGWLNLKEWLKPIGKDRKSRLVIFRTCTRLIHDIPLLQHDELKPNDVDSRSNHKITHAPDALRYWCSRRQLAAYIEPEKEIFMFEVEKPPDEDYYDNGEVTESYLMGGY